METITVETRDGVATVTLNRPDVRNAFNETVIAEMTEVFSKLDARAAVLRGAGKVFCGGADAEWMRRSADRTEAENRADAERMAAMFRAMNECPVPLVGRVHGAVMGGACGFVGVCDVVVAAADCKFAFSEVRLGVVPAVISPFVLRKMGESAARRWFLTGETFDAAEARRLGLVHEVVSPGALDGKIAEIVGKLLEAGPQAAREAKKLIRTVMPLPWDEALDYAAATIARVRASPEGQEGLRAFIEKRKAGWLP